MKTLCYLMGITGLILNFCHAGELTARFVLASPAILDNPHDLKLSADGRYLYVSDVGNDRITVLDPDSLEMVGHFGADHQDGTHDIDFDESGVAYVADTHNNRVTIYQVDGIKGSLQGELTESIRGPEGVLAHPNGRIYVAGAWSGNVVAYDNARKVAELTGLSSPHDLALAENGDIWLADSGNHRLLLLTTELKIKRELSQKTYSFNGVRYLDLMEDGTLIAADKYNHQVKFISVDGDLILILGSGKAGKGPNRFTTPEGVEVVGDTLWLSDSGNDRIVKYQITQP